MKFSHLHVHTQFSLLDGAASIQKLYKKAIDDNMPALAISDHGNMFGVFEFVAEAYKHKNEDGSLNALAADAFDDVQTRQRGQHQIHDDRIVVGRERHFQPLAAVFAQVDGIALLLKRALDEAADFGLIFDDQDAHGGIRR